MFVSRLALSLKLKIGDATFDIPTGNIKNLKLDLHAWGFEASLDWWHICRKSPDEDTIFDPFVTPELITVELAIDQFFEDPEGVSVPVRVKGLVTTKSLEERHFPGVAGAPVLHRHYSICFADEAQVLWKQHYPTALYTESSVKSVIEANKLDGMTIEYWWPLLEEPKPTLFLPLGAPNRTASFYDFLMWFLDENHGRILYDTTSGTYRIEHAGAVDGIPERIEPRDVATMETSFPATNRHSIRVHNSYSERAETAVVANTHAARGVFRDVLMTSPLPSEMARREEVENERQNDAAHELRIAFGRYPKMAVIPGTLFRFDPADWADSLYQTSKQYRVSQLTIDAKAVNQQETDGADEVSSPYEIDFEIALGERNDAASELAPYTAPQWPAHVEGKIVSDAGKDDEETYQVYEDPKNLIDHYKVRIPLWDNQHVRVAFDPNLASGHFYFPAYRDERVLLAFDFQEARISRFLDWRRFGARLPKDTQGNQILFGKRDSSKTAVQHVYKDNKPLFNITRVSEGDTQVLKMLEGEICIEVRDDEGR